MTLKRVSGSGPISLKHFRVGILSISLAAVLVFSLMIPGGMAAANSGPPSIVAALQNLPDAPSNTKHRMGLVPSPASSERELLIPPAEGPLPLDQTAAVDLSSQLPPVGDQGQQGSCVGWATSYYYKTWQEKQEHTNWDITNNSQYRFSPAFVYNQINGGHDGGANFDDAFTVMQNKGDIDVADFPYSAQNYTRQPTTDQANAAKPYRIPTGWGSFWLQGNMGPYSSPNPIQNVKTWLDSGKILVMGIPVYNDFPNYGSSPARTYYVYDGTSGLAGGHAVCISGYNDNINPGGADADRKGGFKMVNSWGASWNGANAGFVYLSYDFVKKYVWEAWSSGDLAPDGPSLTSLNSSSGAPGVSVTINGGNFGSKRRNTAVKFNGLAATTSRWTNESITAVVPTGATAGPLRVCDWEGTQSNSIQFTVSDQDGDAPSVTSINPAEAVNTGPVDVSVSGSYFAAGCQVKLVCSGESDVQATSENLVSSGQVDCTLDLSGVAAGAWDVVVTNTDERSGALAGGFTVTGGSGGDTYEPNDGMETAYGPIAPATTYTSYILTDWDVDFYKLEVPSGCRRFSANLSAIPADCDFDFELYDQAGDLVDGSYGWGSIDENLSRDNPDQGTYFLKVYSWVGSSDSEAYRVQFAVDVPTLEVPHITGRSPLQGKVGSLVTLTGRGFGSSRESSYVKFGVTHATTYKAWSNNRITVKVPTGASRRVLIRVVTPGGVSNPMNFWVWPRITRLSRTSGGSGTVVAVKGISFGDDRDESYIKFNDKSVTSCVSWDNDEVKVKVPRGLKGKVALEVRTTGGRSNTAYFTVR